MDDRSTNSSRPANPPKTDVPDQLPGPRNRDALARFTAAILHDLRSPLTTLMAHLAFLLDALAHTPNAAGTDEGTQRSQLRSHVQKATRSADRLAAIIAETQDVVTTARGLQSDATVDVEQVITQVVEDLEQRILTANAQVQLTGPLPQVVGGEVLLRRVFQNLVENALKYGATGHPRVWIGSRQEADGDVGVCVEDNGPGVDPADEGRIFEMFQHLDPRAEGSGTGLAIVSGIMAAHGGHVTVGRGVNLPGACFTVWLRAAED